MNQTASFYAMTSGMDSNGIPVDGWGATAYKTPKVMYYTGSQAESYVSDKLKPVVSGVIICYPADKPSVTDKIGLSGRYFSVVDIDDVGYQGEVCVVPVKAMLNG